MTYSAIFFDLDGTLTDSEPGIGNSIRYALHTFNMDLEKMDLRLFIGPPLYDSFRNLAGLNHNDALRAIELYREYYSQKGIYENALYPGIVDLLRFIRRTGRELVVATSKPEVFARRIITHFRLDTFFSAVCGGDLEGKRIMKADVIRYALTICGLEHEPEKVVMVGDRSYDISGAHANGLAAVAVLYGYGTFEELQIAGATRFAATVGELFSILTEED